MSGTSAALLASVVTIFAMLLYMVMTGRVGAMRGKYKIEAPAVSGHPAFECAYRVQMNTLEAMPLFLPSLWLATAFFSNRFPGTWWLPGALGAIWVVGRYLYMQGYIAAPSKRGAGFGISMFAQLALLILSVIGVIKTWLSVGAVV